MEKFDLEEIKNHIEGKEYSLVHIPNAVKAGILSIAEHPPHSKEELAELTGDRAALLRVLKLLETRRRHKSKKDKLAIRRVSDMIAEHNYHLASFTTL